jgi:hypothetical protein
MSDKKEISAIDAIYEILDRIDLMDKRLQVIDDNVKILSNKFSKFQRLETSAAAAEPSSRVVAPVVKSNSPQNSASQQKVKKLLLGNIRVFGYIVNKEKRPLNEVSVKIYDDKNEIVKDHLTNPDGFWEVRLPKGRYGVEYIHKNFKPINRTIELKGADREYEVK